MSRPLHCFAVQFQLVRQKKEQAGSFDVLVDSVMKDTETGFTYEGPLEIPVRFLQEDRVEAWFLPDSEEDEEVILQACFGVEPYEIIARAMIGEKEYLVIIEKQENSLVESYRVTSRIIWFSS